MKAIKIAELKNGLSRFLKRVAQGESFTITDRTEPVAELIPIQKKKTSKREQLIQQGLIQPAVRSFRSVEITEINESIDIQALLQEVRSES